MRARTFSYASTDSVWILATASLKVPALDAAAVSSSAPRVAAMSISASVNPACACCLLLKRRPPRVPPGTGAVCEPVIGRPWGGVERPRASRIEPPPPRALVLPVAGHVHREPVERGAGPG